MQITARILATGLSVLLQISLQGQSPVRPVEQSPTPLQPPAAYHERFRPQFHFSPKSKWMNDPNGLVFFAGIYHLFFQYYPGDIVWGPMHWGHAVSKDLIHWQQQPIALYPDSLGYIFSGSAVVDSANTSGFGREGKIPLVAIFTHHDPKGEKSGSVTYQNQSLAYSLDGGATWTKYAGNPVLKNPGITDFRDPSVSWHAKEKKWVLSLATKDRITFYSSADLKEWKKESEFGSTLGGHGGVWECPNLFVLQDHWVLLVSNNPGGPNGGSGTQYFIGDWDGHRFIPGDTSTRWIDYGPDDYAGVTFNNTGDRRLFLGWMSNWDYANQVPTKKWRNAMTLPRELSLQHGEEGIFLASQPVHEVERLIGSGIELRRVEIKGSGPTDRLSRYRLDTTGPLHRLKLQESGDKSFCIILSNGRGQQVKVGYDKDQRQYYIDRSLSGITGFNKDFGNRRSIAPRISKRKDIHLTLLVDASSLELFADGGLTVMTAVFFPEQPLNHLGFTSQQGVVFNYLSWSALRTIW